MNREKDWGSDAVPLSSGGDSTPRTSPPETGAGRFRFTLKRVMGRAAGVRRRWRGRGPRSIVFATGVAAIAFAALAIGTLGGESNQAPIRIADPAPQLHPAVRPRRPRQPEPPQRRPRHMRSEGKLEERREPVSSAAIPEPAPPPPAPEPSPEAPVEEPALEAVPAPEPSPPASPPPASPAAAEFGIEQ